MRTNIPDTLKNLIEHPFAKAVLQRSMEVEKDLYGDDFDSLNKLPIRVPENWEYFEMSVGYYISQLFSWCQQLVNNIHFINAKTPNSTLKKRSITSYDLLIYHIENYYIRVQSLYDRILNLTDAVFFLGNSIDNINHKVIVDNSFVKMYKVDVDLRKINKTIRDYLGTRRNQIIHQANYKEQNITELEYYCLFQDGINIPETDYEAKKFIPKIVKKLSQDIIEEKIPEFEKFNDTIFVLLFKYFDKLHKIYLRKSGDLLAIKFADKEYKSATVKTDDV
jgi:hypothetical protein